MSGSRFSPAEGRRFLLLLLFPFFLASLSACGTSDVLGIPRKEAAELLKKGSADFIFQSELPAGFSRAQSRLKELFRVREEAPFYAALLVDSGNNPPEGSFRSAEELSLLLFCAALESPSLPARREAARKLIPRVLEPEESGRAEAVLGVLNSPGLKRNTDAFLLSLKAACLYRLGRFREAAETLPSNPEDGWERALSLFSAWNVSGRSGEGISLKEDITGLLFEELPPDVFKWARGEALAAEGLLSPLELPLFRAGLAPVHYGALLENQDSALADGGLLYFRYPDFIAELGRAYQYTPSAREEGAELFAAWLKLLEMPGEPFSPPETLRSESGAENYRELTAFIQTLPDSSAGRNRTAYLLLHYLGRMQRMEGNYAESSRYFRQAADIAPNGLEEDACLWYTLMNALADNADAAAALIQETIPRWNDVSYFADVLDSVSGALTAGRQWHTLFGIYSALEEKGRSAPLSQYAWILGRAEEEGYIETGRTPEAFFLTALEEEGSLYHRIMAASRLRAAFTPSPSASGKGEAEPEKTNPEETDFILGFFECGAASFAPPYIEAQEAELTTRELRKAAEALAYSGRHRESIELVSRYTGRQGGDSVDRKDLALLYPRPYQNLVETYAREAELEPELLYGLIRTESYFTHDIVSRSGAAGLTQLMTPTAAEMAGRIARQGGADYRAEDGLDLNDPETNIHIGSYYLRYLHERMESLMPALLAYNAGPGRMRRWLAADRARGSLPPDIFPESIEYAETREYGRRVLTAAAVYGYLYYDKSTAAAAAYIYR